MNGLAILISRSSYLDGEFKIAFFIKYAGWFMLIIMKWGMSLWKCM